MKFVQLYAILLLTLLTLSLCRPELIMYKKREYLCQGEADVRSFGCYFGNSNNTLIGIHKGRALAIHATLNSVKIILYADTGCMGNVVHMIEAPVGRCFNVEGKPFFETDNGQVYWTVKAYDF